VRLAFIIATNVRGSLPRPSNRFRAQQNPLTKWWLAMHLIGSSKKGISSHQLHRMLGISYKSTWFMMHRIREAMATLF